MFTVVGEALGADHAGLIDQHGEGQLTDLVGQPELGGNDIGKFGEAFALVECTLLGEFAVAAPCYKVVDAR